MKLEKFVDFTQETIAEYATTADTYHKYHCIIPLGSRDVNGALEETLHCLIENGASDEDIYNIMGAEQVDLSQVKEEELEDYISIDLGYYICGQLMMFQSLEQIKGVPKILHAPGMRSVRSHWKESSRGSTQMIQTAFMSGWQTMRMFVQGNPLWISLNTANPANPRPQKRSASTPKEGLSKPLSSRMMNIPVWRSSLNPKMAGNRALSWNLTRKNARLTSRFTGWRTLTGTPIETYAMSM